MSQEAPGGMCGVLYMLAVLLAEPANRYARLHGGAPKLALWHYELNKCWNKLNNLIKMAYDTLCPI